MSETLLEYVDSRGVAIRVDREAGVMRGVKILGLRSRNGREYLPEALTAAAALYEGAKVNVNHPKGHPASPRDYQDRIGVIRGVAVRAGLGLFGDFHFNPKHALAEQLVWDAEHAAENVGFSHNVEARTRRQGEATVIEAITRVQSVDLVADPATTRGLFESQQSSASAALTSWQDLTPDLLRTHRADLVVQLTAPLATQLAAAQAGERRRLLATLLAEYQLPDPATHRAAATLLLGEELLAELASAADEAAMRRLISGRAELIAAARRWRGRESIAAPASPALPCSRDQAALLGVAPVDAHSFAAAIRG